MSIKTFTTRSSFIEALQFRQGMLADEITEFVTCDLDILYNAHEKVIGLELITRDGSRIANDGDWIIKERLGEFYLLSKSTFETIYVETNSPVVDLISTTLEPGMTAFKNGVSVTNYGSVPAQVTIKTPKKQDLPPVDFSYDEKRTEDSEQS